MNSRIIIFVIVGVPLLVGAYFAGPVVWDSLVHRRAADRILIPNGYTGWARIDFGVKDAAALPHEQRGLLIALKPNGTLQTSSLKPKGLGKDEYFYSTGSSRAPLSTSGVCKGGMIWGVATDKDSANSVEYEKFFVGTEEQFRREMDPSGKLYPRCE